MQKNRKRKRRKTVDWWIGRLALVLYIVVTIVFAVSVISTKLLPAKLIVVMLAALALLALLVGLLIWYPRYRGRYVTGLVLTVVLCILYGLGTSYVSKTMSAAKTITTVKTETAAIGIYVRADDTNEFTDVEDTYTYGILSELDRENTDEAISQLSQEFGFTLKTAAYPGLTQLIDALFNEEVDAIILNSAYLDLLEELEGYEDAADRLKEVKMAMVEREVEVVTTPDAEDIPEDRLVGVTDASDSGEDGLTFTVFISGIDTRGALTAKSRSDVNILASVNTATKQIVLISTPRDYYVPLSISNGAKDKLTHAGIYGVNVCMDTMAMLYNVNVDYYFRVNFYGFIDIIDALGGVTVNSDYAFTTTHGNYTIVQGENYMDGDTALGFVRERYAFASGDRQRGKNQIAVIKAALKKAMSPELLMNYSNILTALEGSFETSIPYDTLSTIVREQLASGGEWNIVSYSVDGTGDSQIPYSMSQYAYVMIPDESTVETAKSLIAQVYNGEIVTAP